MNMMHRIFDKETNTFMLGAATTFTARIADFNVIITFMIGMATLTLAIIKIAKEIRDWKHRKG